MSFGVRVVHGLAEVAMPANENASSHSAASKFAFDDSDMLAAVGLLADPHRPLKVVRGVCEGVRVSVSR